MSSRPLEVDGDVVKGEIALAIKPGTVAAAQARAIDEALADAFHALSLELGVTLAAQPSRYAQPLDGRDEQGRVRFVVRARIEGETLVPVRAKKQQKRPHADERAKQREERRARADRDEGGEGGEGEP